jgi:hypothetical protein
LVRRIGGGGGTLRLGCAQARVVADTVGVFPVHMGTWCSGITSALHAEGPGFNPQCVHLRQRGLGGGAVAFAIAQCYDSLAEWSKALAQGASPQGRGFEPHSCHFPARGRLFGWRGGGSAGHIGRAHGVVVSHPLSMREALGSIPSVSRFCHRSCSIIGLQYRTARMRHSVCN